MAAFGGGDSCSNCGARMAADQRYCLNCGHRRGEPRLPFMDAVVFMESMGPGGGVPAAPPPPPTEPGSSNRMNANAALIAGVATLVLAIGVGFLIGRSGHDGSNNAAAQAPIKVIEVGGGNGGGESTETAAVEEPGAGNETKAKSGKAKKSSGKSAEEGQTFGSERRLATGRRTGEGKNGGSSPHRKRRRNRNQSGSRRQVQTGRRRL